jgi:hypothetical protein
MAAGTETFDRTALRQHGTKVLLPRWSAAAWAAAAVSVAFVAVTCWWLDRDHSIPVFDAGMHLGFAIDVYERLSSGHLASALTASRPYPPLTYIVGALGIFIGGVGVAPPIIALNLVFVPLLALGCYKVGRIAFGPLAGLLAVVFALGCPLIIEEFHEFMLDAPEAAMVAVAVWAVLASERFLRVGVSALAGVTVGLGLLSKETFAYFLAGVVLVTAVRGGRRAWRGIAAFAAIVLVIALPWYLNQLSTVHQLASEALGPSTLANLGIAPPRFSRANLEWYFWSVVNWQLFLPLFAFAAAGWVWAVAGFARRRPVSDFASELTLGALISWAALTETYVHDARYSIPLTVYLAVFGAGWVASLPRAPQIATALALAAVALANTLGVGFGVGPYVASTSSNVSYEQQPGRVTFYANYGLWLGPPARDGDLLGLLRALRREGVHEVRWSSEDELESNFSLQGITVLARIAGLRVPSKPVDPATASRVVAVLRHGGLEAGFASPCTILHDGAGVWLRRGGSRGVNAWDYCPRGFT